MKQQKVGVQASQTGEQDLLKLANEELRKKEKLLRETRKRLDGFEGKNLENKSKNDLLQVQKQLSD